MNMGTIPAPDWPVKVHAPCRAAAGAAKLSPGRLVAGGVQTRVVRSMAAPYALKGFQWVGVLRGSQTIAKRFVVKSPQY